MHLIQKPESLIKVITSTVVSKNEYVGPISVAVKETEISRHRFERASSHRGRWTFRYFIYACASRANFEPRENNRGGNLRPSYNGYE